MKTKIRTLLGSVAAKILVIMLALAGTTVAAILVSGSLISTINDEVDTLVAESIPPLETASGIANSVSSLKDAINTLLTTNSHLAIDSNSDTVRETRSRLLAQIQDLDLDQYANIETEMASLTADIDALMAARSAELSAQSRNMKALSTLNQQSRELSETLQGRIDRASFALLLAGNNASSKSNQSLKHLLKREVDALRLTLLLKSELNLTVGATQALLETNDLGTRSDLQAMASEAQAQIDALLVDMENNTSSAEFVPSIREASAFQAEFITLSPFDMKVRAHLLRTSQETLNEVTSQAVESVLADLDAESTNTLAQNAKVVTDLLNTDVKNITDLARLDTSLKSILIKALQGAASINAGYIHALQFEIDSEAPHIRDTLQDLPPDLAEKVALLLEATNPESGLLATRIEALQARGLGQVATDSVSSDLLRISDMVMSISKDSIIGISDASQTLMGTAKQASMTMNGIALIAAAIVLGAPVLTFLLIMRPLSAVTASTERLAIGDMTEIKRVGGQYGEIARLFSALTVFRNNLVEKDRMENEAAENARRATQAQEEAAREKTEREAAELERQKQQETRDRERELATEQERRALEEAAEAERKARHAEQSAVVEALAEGLRRLSQGDVRQTIDQQFPASYEQLRMDYNAAVSSLRSVVERLSETAQTIHSNSGEISNAADDLSRRTERAASTLGETASALTQLTAAVKSAADGAALANKTVGGAKMNAQSASSVVKEAISAMDAISDSSGKISKIISVIDDIAFQTNLLALNAGVEAARAGEAGRGFAVVASEVRALAQRSSEAAREINNLISESGQEVGRGVSLVDQTGEALRSIVHDVSEIATHMSEIATSAEEQSAGISEINTAVANLDQTTQQNAAMFEETTAASFSLANEAATLSEIVSQFVLKEDDSRPSTAAASSPKGDDDFSLAS